jgi:hypothetical protein
VPSLLRKSFHLDPEVDLCMQSWSLLLYRTGPSWNGHCPASQPSDFQMESHGASVADGPDVKGHEVAVLGCISWYQRRSS